jgi:WD40 repeat protein
MFRPQVICWNVLTGEKILQEVGNLACFYGSNDALLVACSEYRAPSHQASWRSLRDIRRSHVFAFENICEIAHLSQSNNGNFAIIRHAANSDSNIERLVRALGLKYPFAGSDLRINAAIFDVRTGEHLVEIPSVSEEIVEGIRPLVSLDWSPDDKTLATLQSGTLNVWNLWDIPPRKSVTWFAAGAALLALPIAFVARRRVRELRAA